MESVRQEITEKLECLVIENIDLIAFMKEEKRNKEASNEDGIAIIAEIVGEY